MLSDALGELQRGIENVEYASYAPELLKGEHSKNVGPAVDSWSEFQALGGDRRHHPFNFPAMVPLWMWPMAVACGNTFVLKPSERDPSSTLRVAELALEAGLPPVCSTWSTVTRKPWTHCCRTLRVKAISFVGSTPLPNTSTPRAASTASACRPLGGAKNHAVVMPDADIGNAVCPDGCGVWLLRRALHGHPGWWWLWEMPLRTP